MKTTLTIIALALLYSCNYEVQSNGRVSYFVPSQSTLEYKPNPEYNHKKDQMFIDLLSSPPDKVVYKGFEGYESWVIKYPLIHIHVNHQSAVPFKNPEDWYFSANDHAGNSILIDSNNMGWQNRISGETQHKIKEICLQNRH